MIRHREKIKNKHYAIVAGLHLKFETKEEKMNGNYKYLILNNMDTKMM